MKMIIYFKKVIALVLIGVSANIYASEWQPAPWPVLRHYDQQHLREIALPLGGIGTGTVSLGGRGELRDWEIMNVPGKGFSTVKKGNNTPFVAIYVKPKNGEAITSMLAGQLYDDEYLDCEGRPANNFGMPRFEETSFDAAYPFGQVNLRDSAIPVTVRIKGFNPPIPCNTDDSSLPVAVLAYEVTNPTDRAMEVSVCVSMRNFIGCDGTQYNSNGSEYFPYGAKNNKNIYREQDEIKGIFFYSDGVDKAHQAWGTMALTTDANGQVTYRTCSKPNRWENAILNFWDDFSADGLLTQKEWPLEDDPLASLAVKKHLAPGTTERFNFYLTWNFPNRKGWSQTVVGNYYSLLYDDAWDAAEKIVPRIPQLEQETLRFVGALLGSTYPDVVKEAALFNLSVLRSQEKRYEKGAVILAAGQPTEQLGLVLSGSVTIESNDFWGNRTILNHVGQGGFFAESYAWLSDAVMLVDAVANEDCRILFMNVGVLRALSPAAHPWAFRLTGNLLTISADKNLALSGRSFHTAPKSARERIMAVFTFRLTNAVSRETASTLKDSISSRIPRKILLTHSVCLRSGLLWMTPQSSTRMEVWSISTTPYPVLRIAVSIPRMIISGECRGGKIILPPPAP